MKEWVQHSVPLHFVCKRLGVLNHLALFRWGGAGPASDGQEAIETQLVTRPAAAAANKTHVWGPTFEAKRRGVALPLRLVIGTRGRSCRQEKKRRDRRGCLRHRSHNPNGTFWWERLKGHVVNSRVSSLGTRTLTKLTYGPEKDEERRLIHR